MPCPAGTFDILRRMAPMRQMEAAELMTGQSNYTDTFAKAILAATPEAQPVDTRKKTPGGEQAVSAEQIARLNREHPSFAAQGKAVAEHHGINHRPPHGRKGN